VCIAHDPGVRPRDIASTLAITERCDYGVVTDLTAAGCVVKCQDGRRNRYQVQTLSAAARSHWPGSGRSVRCWTFWSTQILLSPGTGGLG
jgi:hypothetical protein